MNVSILKEILVERMASHLTIFLLAVALVVGCPVLASASCNPNLQSCSSGYGVNEVFFGSGGALNACSSGGTYCAKESAGETGVGNTSGTAFQAQAGFNTDRTPSLTFIVNSASITLGSLSVGTPATSTATFSVESYLASGYQVVTDSPGPTNGSYTMTALSSPGTSSPSTEQFGINLVANTSCGNGLPASLGANPVQVPSSSFSFGAASSGYNTACNFKYHNGDVIASSSKSSGETDFTISYLINISSVTPAGTYSMNHVLVATSTF